MIKVFIMEKIKYYIDYLSESKPKKDEVVEYLSQREDIGDDYKNLIYFYLFPRNLMDMELPSRIMSYRGEDNKNGYLEPNVIETGLLLEAYRTRQYNRYMRHLLHSFHNPDLVFPLLGHDKCECGICKKSTWAYDEWKKICEQYPETSEENKKEFLAFGCDSSKITICLPCLTQLLSLHQLLTLLEGDKYLDWRENVWTKKVKTRLASRVGLENDNNV